MRHFHHLVASGLLLLALGCQRDDEIHTYRVSKEATPPMPTAPETESAPASNAREISWKTPEGWIEQSPSSMRVGSFLVKGANGQQADVSVIPLSGEAGGELANINRWRGQIDLKLLTEADLPAQIQKITPAGRPMHLVDMDNQKKRLIAAIYQQGSRSWFFKMLGDDATVEGAKPAFLQFLHSLKFHER